MRQLKPPKAQKKLCQLSHSPDRLPLALLKPPKPPNKTQLRQVRLHAQKDKNAGTPPKPPPKKFAQRRQQKAVTLAVPKVKRAKPPNPPPFCKRKPVAKLVVRPPKQQPT